MPAPLPALEPKGAAFAVTDMAFRYPGGRHVFQSFSLSARPGEFVVLLGPSGCGKTTLLNLLSGFLAPERGTITIEGAPVTPEHPALGYVFQSPNLFPWLTILENARFGLRMSGGATRAEQREAALRVLRLVGLEPHADEQPHRLSGGQRQRAALARALALRPRVLLMDEPFAALDAITRAEMQDELLRLWAELGQTILFITHDIDEALCLADRVLVLGLPPSGVRFELTNDIPRPRSSGHIRSSPRFAELRERLAAQIAEVKAASPSMIPAQDS